MIEGIIIAWHVLLGLIVGSFLNVVIYRFNTGKSLGGRSHCLSCGHLLSWRHLVPVFSYLALLGKCAFCQARISPRYFVVEILTGALFGIIAYTVGDVWVRPLYLLLACFFVLIIVYDVLHTIIPDEFVIAVAVLAVSIGLYDVYVTGDLMSGALRLLSGGVGFFFFFSLWYMSSGRWIGLGDAKLAVPLGIIVSWPGIVSTIILSFWIGAVLSVFLLVLQSLMKRGQKHLRFIPTSLTIKSEIPFAPFLILGFLLVHLYHIDVFTLIEKALSSLYF